MAALRLYDDTSLNKSGVGIYPDFVLEYFCLIASSLQIVPSYLAPENWSFYSAMMVSINGKNLDYGNIPEGFSFLCQNHFIITVQNNSLLFQK